MLKFDRLIPLETKMPNSPKFLLIHDFVFALFWHRFMFDALGVTQRAYYHPSIDSMVRPCDEYRVTPKLCAFWKNFQRSPALVFRSFIGAVDSLCIFIACVPVVFKSWFDEADSRKSDLGDYFIICGSFNVAKFIRANIFGQILNFVSN